MTRTILLTLLLVPTLSQAQNAYYFPPTTSAAWEKVDPLSLGWCPEQIDSLYQFLADKNTRSFIVLHQGKIALERYYGTADSASVWYWASAGKSLLSFLMGMAQEEGLLNIQDSTSTYLGTGWTATTPQQEREIRLVHQLSMTTGLADTVTDQNCQIDSCLLYLTDPNTRWAYYNAPYRLLQSVLENASGLSLNQYTNQALLTRIGLKGTWLNQVRWGNARDMARFGLLMLAEGIWEGDTLLHDQTYFQAMITPSQSLNPAYGYLWWLNGQSTYLLPQTQFQFPGKLIPNAPNDLYAGLGKNDQKIHVVPSLDLVVIRQGDAAGNAALASSSFDNELWEQLNQVFCAGATSLESSMNAPLSLFPNPARDQLKLLLPTTFRGTGQLLIRDLFGRPVLEKEVNQVGGETLRLSVLALPTGYYTVELLTPTQRWRSVWQKG